MNILQDLSRIHQLIDPPIRVHPDIPKLKPKVRLSPKLDVTPEFRKEFDAWLLEFFGGEPCIYAGVDPVRGKDAFVFMCNPAYEQQLRLALLERI